MEATKFSPRSTNCPGCGAWVFGRSKRSSVSSETANLLFGHAFQQFCEFLLVREETLYLGVVVRKKYPAYKHLLAPEEVPERAVGRFV